MSENEAMRLGEEIRGRFENLKQAQENSITFEELLEKIKSIKKSILEANELEKNELSQEFLFSKWVDFISKAFLIKHLGITLQSFNNKDEMKEHIKVFNEFEVKGNSYLVKTNENCYEIGMHRFDILGFIHELGHIVQKEDMIINQIVWDGRTQNLEELRVDIFARSFWMPKKCFESVVTQNSCCGKCDVDAVANYFSVDYVDAFLRGKDLCIW
ncbi:MAG: hypothetical protein IJ300_07990 [Clostridia bacterium]|nr:hypothetical protein [Clostridia bacterium]MBQ8767045.1 hypothetical protein [Clostridia bacterium]